MLCDSDNGQRFVTVYPSIFPLSFLTSLHYYPNHQLNSPLHLSRRKSIIRISPSPPFIWFLRSVNQRCQRLLLTALTSAPAGLYKTRASCPHLKHGQAKGSELYIRLQKGGCIKKLPSEEDHQRDERETPFCKTHFHKSSH
jgi:hypothetical protein